MTGWFQELRRRKVLRVLGAYGIAAWVVLQVADVLASMLELPDWAPKLVLFLIACGVIPVVVLAWAYELTPDGLRRDKDAGTTSSDVAPQKKPSQAMAAAGILLLAGLGAGAYWMSSSDSRWAISTALPELEAYIGSDDWDNAYTTALQINARVPGSALLDNYWSRFSTTVEIPSEPAGATVYHRPYDQPDAEWQVLGLTPVQGARLPRGFSQIRVELEGYEPVTRVVGHMPVDGLDRLDADEMPDGRMVMIPAVDIVLDPVGNDSVIPDVRVPGNVIDIEGERISLSDFRIDRFEVTNQQYLEFVRAGGYERKEFWEYEFFRDDEPIAWEQAMQAFTDSTGQTGPATWVGGIYPEGQAEFPVGGISWYEAAAFARYSRRELPTLHHWREAHAEALLTWQVPASNTDTDSVAAVGSYPSLGWTGTYDMLGNVREWCFNALGGNQRTIVGGAWDTLPYMVQHSITYSTALPAFDRSPQNGMRLATLNDDRTARAVLRRPIKPATPIEVVPAATDDVFEAFVRNFEQGDTALRATIEGETPISDWTRQKITFDRGDGERVGLYLYLPDTDASRYPTVVYWPSAMAFNQDSPPENMHLDFLVRRGWAVALVVLERTFDRRLVPAVALDAVAYRDVMIRRVRELRRTIDYLETRPDIDTASLAYYGLSWGGFVAPLPLVAEPRLKVAILNQTGVVENLPYDIDTAHYLPRVRQPVLQFNGRYDTDFRYEDSALPFFELLGSEHKKHVVEPTGHFVAVSTVIGETLAWLDTHVPR